MRWPPTEVLLTSSKRCIKLRITCLPPPLTSLKHLCLGIDWFETSLGQGALFPRALYLIFERPEPGAAKHCKAF